MTTAPTPQTVKRLAMIRFLFDQGVGLASQPEPLSAPAVNCFQDAVEQFLLLAAEHLKVNLKTQIQFAEYWTELQPALPGQVPLPGKQPMGRMNKLRVAFKHHGTVPSSTALAQAQADVSTFLTDATTLVFGISFDEINLDHLIDSPLVQRLLKEADDFADKGSVAAFAVGMLRLHDCFKLLFGPFARPEISNLDWAGIRSASRGAEWEQLLHAVEFDIHSFQHYWPVFLLGLDYKDYARFVNTCPRHHLGPTWPTNVTSDDTRVWYEPRNMTRDNYDFCRSFLVTAALRAAKLGGSFQVVVGGETRNATVAGLLEAITVNEMNAFDLDDPDGD